jgi:hypothetical protein
MFDSVDNIFNIDNPPLAIQAMAELAAVTCAAAVVNIQPGKTARSPELYGRVKRAARAAGGAAMYTDE